VPQILPVVMCADMLFWHQLHTCNPSSNVSYIIQHCPLLSPVLFSQPLNTLLKHCIFSTNTYEQEVLPTYTLTCSPTKEAQVKGSSILFEDSFGANTNNTAYLRLPRVTWNGGICRHTLQVDSQDPQEQL
jgi:hypothetical protein